MRGIGKSRTLLPNRMLFDVARNLAVIVAPLLLPACGGAVEATEAIGQTEQPLAETATADTCGYRVTSGVVARWSRGYIGWIELKNLSGPVGRDFEVFADLGGARIAGSAFARHEPVDGGYLFSAPDWREWVPIAQGRRHRFEFRSTDPFVKISPYLLTINGAACDTVAPTVSLEASSGFYTAGGTMTLTATATDNVAIRKVVFERDGREVATDTEAPYTLNVAISDALNGRHRYTAKAYDPSGNSAISNAKSVLTAIGNKFAGTAPDTGADYADLLNYFDQITPANAGKWGSVEATRDEMNWTPLDTAYEFAKQHGLPFKFHTLVWGSQQPSWLTGLSAAEQLAEIDQWMSLVAGRYPAIDLIDVVNEPMHSTPSYREALGGAGATGWDWVVKAFEMARAHFPTAELILNDYNVLIMEAFTNDYLPIINVLKDRNLIDGIGLQGHFLERAELPVVAKNLDTLAATGLPIYISEFDINFANDARQAQRVSELFPIFWQHPSVVGVTHWGHLQGHTWQPDAYLLRSDGTARPALDWLMCYRNGNTNCEVPEYVAAARTGSPSGITLEAEDYDDAQGLVGLGASVAYTDDGDWERFRRVVFQDAWDTLTITYSKGSEDAGHVTIHLDSLENAPIATVELPPTGAWGTSATVSLPWTPIHGEHDVVVVYHGVNGVANVNHFRFSAPSTGMTNLLTDGDFESSAGSWFTWGGGSLGVTNSQAHGGGQSLRLAGRTGNDPIARSLMGLVTPAQSYQVEFWVSIGGAATASVNLTQKIECSGSSAGYSWLASPQVVAEGQWAKLAGTLSVPDCPLADLLIYAEGPDAGVDLYIDDVAIRQQ